MLGLLAASVPLKLLALKKEAPPLSLAPKLWGGEGAAGGGGAEVALSALWEALGKELVCTQRLTVTLLGRRGEETASTVPQPRAPEVRGGVAEPQARWF